MTYLAATPQDIAAASTNAILEPVTQFVGGTAPSIPKAILLFIIGFITIKVLSRVLTHALGLAKLPKGMIKVSVKLLDLVLWVLLTIALLQLAGLSNVALAMSGAFAVLALAFSQGFSTTVGDTISGLNLARDKHFRIGDKVRVGPIEQKIEGVIIDMDTRKSRLKDESGQIFVVPNSVIDRNSFILLERASKMHSDKQRIVKPRLNVAKPGTIRAKKGA
jgi:small-conductance mechanosensitive channel